MEKSVKAIKKNLLVICWNMRGSISYSEAMHLSSEEMEIISSIISDNMEVTNKSGLPYF